ncbi:hypothetical protein N7519_008536 [Penicillium mononematosum]|nr:hypothetical protein N7519_008536 [Penicillium mononematosum]
MSIGSFLSLFANP